MQLSKTEKQSRSLKGHHFHCSVRYGKRHPFMIRHEMLIALIGLENKNHPQEKKWTPSLHAMTNSYTYLHNGLSPSPSMPVANKTLHTFLVHLASNSNKMPSHRFSINSNSQNTQCLALPALCHEAWPTAHIVTFTGEFCHKRELKNWKCSEFGNFQLLAVREKKSENRQISIFGFQCEAKCGWMIKDLYFTLVYSQIWLNRSRDDRHFFDTFLGIIVTSAA